MPKKPTPPPSSPPPKNANTNLHATAKAGTAPLTADNSPHRWPDGALVYHIYPRSFMDSNGDGVGDLAGITQRLEYIKSLGAGTIWLSPFYPSPMADFGYDVANYCDVDSIFGTLDDFKALLAAAHELDIRVLVDLVPNHTSDEHPWFTAARQSKDNAYSDWYIWRDALSVDGAGNPQPPNNWRDALSGGPAWQWVPERQQFYLHSFTTKQPDLNWTNPAVREAMKEVMRFWLNIGVDGFRVDAVYWMAKHPLLHDDAINPDYVEGEDLRYYALKHNNSRGWPAVYAYLSELAEVLHEPPYQAAPRFMVTEAYPDRHNPLPAYLNFYASVDPKVAAPFNFEGLTLPWYAPEWRKFLRSFHSALRQFSNLCVPSYAFGNHDQPRLASRLGEAAARSAAVLLLTLPGMVFLYYGDELGMKDVAIPADQIQDPGAAGDPKHHLGRDPERTPMQWSSEPNAGFSTAARTWLPLAEDYQQYNVVTETADPDSTLSLYRTLGQLRRQSESLQFGSLTMLETDSDQVLAFIRTGAQGAKNYLTVINFAAETVSLQLDVQIYKKLVSSALQAAPAEQPTVPAGTVVLQPHEGALYQLV